MVPIIFGLLPMLYFPSFSVVMICLAMMVPIMLAMLYKTNSVVVDLFFNYSFMSCLMGLLSVSLMLLIFLASSESKSYSYVFLQVSLLILLLFCFTVHNLLAFYVFFEACLIPILLMIITWGYQPERLQAGTYMIMYTVVGSLPLLLVILYLAHHFGSYSIFSVMKFATVSKDIYLVGFFAFLIKLPMYGTHVWLPKAHVEAPLGGSMILAGVLLKLGGYGMFLWNNMLTYSTGSNSVLLMFVLVSLWGGFLASVVCLSQSDVKAMIAYSSVVHMSVIVLTLLSNTSWGDTAAAVILVAHGWTSSAMFLLAFMTYNITGSRSFSYTKGMLVCMPSLGLLWFLSSMLNMGFPPSLNFLGEVFAVPSSLFLGWKVTLTLGLIMFMSVAYNMYLYTQLNHGACTQYLLGSKSPSSRLMLSVVGHMCPLVLLVSLSFFM